MPGVNEREQIWRVQLHSRTPLAQDVDFRALAEEFEASGGDIRNAVLKAAMTAAAEPGNDAFKAIHQRHFQDGIREVLASKRVMRQSLLDAPATQALGAAQGREYPLLPPIATTVAITTGVLGLIVAFVALAVALMR